VARALLLPGIVGVRRYDELVAWQLAAELRDRVVALTAAPRPARDLGFCNQIRRASASAPANLAEGFARFHAREFARFVVIARGSLAETENHVEDGRRRGYFSDADAEDLQTLCRRAAAASTHLLRYLLSRSPRRPTRRHRSSPPPRSGER
jgi:four helix bundle protein